jgi:Kae1-associated kinase Bud32
LIGRNLSHYKILGEIGRGGMGIVYRAHDLKLSREVALKVLPEDAVANALRKQRFVREARAAAALKHPGIAVIYEIDEDAGLTFITMELVEGKKLSELIKRKELTPDTVIPLAIQVGEALSHAHDRGIVHRDLKPANVMVAEGGKAKLIDFGLAKLVEPAMNDLDPTTERPLESISGVIMGTLVYMSPEQARGHGVDHRTDIFSFGGVLYEMLTGETAFGRATYADTLAALLTASAPQLPESVLASAANVRGDLDLIIQRCLCKRQEDRYQAMADVVRELEAVRDWLENGLASATGRVVVPQASGASATPLTSIAVLPFTDMSAAKDQDYFCEGMAEEIINALSRVEGLRVAARTSAFQFKGEARDVRSIGRALNVRTVLEGSVRTAEGRLRVTTQLIDAATGYQLWSQRYDSEARDVFQLQDRIASQIGAALEVQLGTGSFPKIKRYTQNLDAYHDYLKGRYNWFKRHRGGAQAAIEWYGRAIARDPSHAPAHAGLAKSYAMLGVYGFLPPSMAEAKTREAAERAALLDDELAESHEALWTLRFWCEWNWDAAEREILRAIALEPRQGPVHGWHALFSCFKGDMEAAIEQAQRGVELDPLSAYGLVVLGMVLLGANRPDRAIAELERALEFEPEFSLALFNLGSAYTIVGRHEDALATMERAAAISARASFFLGWLGWAYGAAGRYDEARKVLSELAERSRAQYVPPLAFAWITSKLPEGPERERTAEWVEKAFAERSPLLTFWPLPVCDALRADPRFTNLRERMNAV